MITDLNKIVKEWSYRVDDGKPNPNNSTHLYHLSEILIENKWTFEVIDELSGSFEPDAYKNTTDAELLDDLKLYMDLAEGKLLKEEKFNGAIIRKGSSDKAKEDTKIVRQALKKTGIKFTNRGEFGMDFKDADLAQIKKVIAGEKVGEFIVSRDEN